MFLLLAFSSVSLCALLLSCSILSFFSHGTLTHLVERHRSKKRISNYNNDTMNTRKVYQFLYLLSCLSALIWQLVLIFDLYFQYKASSTTRVFFPDIIEPRSVVFCPGLSSALDMDRVNREMGRNWSHPMPVPTIMINKVKEEQLNNKKGKTRNKKNDDNFSYNLTVMQEFDYTHPPESVVSGVIYRSPSSPLTCLSHGMNFQTTDDDSVDIKVVKYLTGPTVCYQVSIKEKKKRNETTIKTNSTRTSSSSSYPKKNLHSDDVSMALESPGLINLVRFGKDFKRAVIVKVLVADDDDGPVLLQELQNAPYFFVGYNKTDGKVKLNYFTVDDFVMRQQLLPDPYETRCLDYQQVGNYRDQIDCRHKCITRETMKRFNLFPSFPPLSRKDNIVRKRGNVTSRMSGYNYQLSWEKEVSKIREYCQSHECSKTSCSSQLMLSNVEKAWRPTNDYFGKNDSFVVKRILPIRPSFDTTTRPTLSLVELIIYILGTLSTWTGLSILDLDPVTLVTKLLSLWNKRTVGRVSLVHPLVSDSSSFSTSSSSPSSTLLSQQQQQQQRLVKLERNMDSVTPRTSRLERDYLHLVRKIQSLEQTIAQLNYHVSLLSHHETENQ